MGFWWYMLANNMFIPIVLIVGGILMHKRCPKEINALLGYRTTRSMKNAETWKFAHTYCGKIWRNIGTAIVIPTLLVQIPFYNSTKDTIGNVGLGIMGVQLFCLFFTIFLVERALKREFDDDGKRRN